MAVIAALTLLLAADGKLATPASAQPAGEGSTEPTQTLRVPEDDIGAKLLGDRAAAQERTRGRFDVPVDFSFTDEQEASGLDFDHRATEDGGKVWKMVHYDHGNGISVADVDGDGRLDVYFLNQLGPNALYRNLGDGRFEDMTTKAGVALADKVSVTAAFADADNDGDADLFVTTVKMGNVYFENDGSGKFRDATAAAGLEHVGHSSGAVFVDYDLDGRLDLFVTNVGEYTTDEFSDQGYYLGHEDAFHGHLKPSRTETSILYRNVGSNRSGGARFEDVSASVGLVDGSWSGDAAFADLDGDHYPELYLLNMQGDDRFYRNLPAENGSGRRFVDQTAKIFPKTPWGSMGVKFFDYNNDGRLDLLLTDMHSDMSEEIDPSREKLKADMQWVEPYLAGGDNNIWGNAFFENQSEVAADSGSGSLKFDEVSDLVGAENYWPWGVTVADLNADGWEDAFITASMSFPFRYGINSVLLNNQGKTFLDSEFLLGIEPRRGDATAVEMFEIDCSGADKDHNLCKDREGQFTVQGTLGTRSTVILDLEGDGDLDIVTTEFNARPQVLVSDLAERRTPRFIHLSLRGTKSNRDGLGAMVAVNAGDRTLYRYHDGKSGYLSQSSMPMYIGLGAATKIDSIEVRWPSGEIQTVTDGLRVGASVEIVEPSESD